TAISGWVVGTGHEGLSIGQEKDGHRPAAVSGDELRRGHVERVDIRSLLTIDFDGDEVLVQEPSNLCIFEGLVGHDVAPVTRRVAHGQKYRSISALRFVERVVAPRAPQDGVVHVIQEVGRTQFVAYVPQEWHGELTVKP